MNFQGELAHRMKGDYLFLRAQRNESGERNFKMLIGEPLRTSFGMDLYNSVFADSQGVTSKQR